MKLRFVLVLCAAVALTVGVATATAGGGNSENAKKCQKGGWKTYTRSDGTSFRNQGACVSYAAHGGVLVASSRLLCESLGGTFGTGPDLIGASANPVVWVCNGWFIDEADIEEFFSNLGKNPLFTGCLADGGSALHVQASGLFPATEFEVDVTCYGPS